MTQPWNGSIPCPSLLQGIPAVYPALLLCSCCHQLLVPALRRPHLELRALAGVEPGLSWQSRRGAEIDFGKIAQDTRAPRLRPSSPRQHFVALTRSLDRSNGTPMAG